MTNENSKQKILIVDDVQEYIEILVAIFGREYVTLVARNGPDALSIAISKNPDLILLDIIMPDMNGYDVCKALKSESITRDIPVVFISAKNDGADVSYGISLGAIDYITKPFDKVVVQTKVKHQLQKESQRRLAQSIHVSRCATLGEVAAGIAHEIDQPLAGISCTTVFLKNAYEMNKLCDKDFHGGIKDINDCVNKISRIITHIRTLAKQDSHEPELFDIHKTIDDALMLLDVQLRIHQIKVVKVYDKSLPVMECVPAQLEQVWINNIVNARDSFHEKGETVGKFDKSLIITTKYNAANKTVDVEFTDNGMGITNSVKKKMFDPFFTTKGVGKGTGLGLSVNYDIISQHRGTISVTSQKGDGATISVCLPVQITENKK